MDVSRRIAMAGSGVQDERLNDPDGFREGGTVFAAAMDDLNPCCPVSGVLVLPYNESTPVDVRHTGESNGGLATHRDGWQWCARSKFERLGRVQGEW